MSPLPQLRLADDSPVHVVKSCYDAFARGNIPEIIGLCAEDVEWVVPGSREIPYTGTYRGKAEVKQFFAQLGAAVDFTKFDPTEYLVDGERVVTLGFYAATVKASGHMFAADWAMLYTIHNGRIRRFREFTDTHALAYAFKVYED